MFKVVVFWEDWFSNPYPFSRLCDWMIEEPTLYLLGLFKKYNITAEFYCLGTTCENYRKLYQEIVLHGHTIGNHGYEHVKELVMQNNRPYISPNAWLGFTGGFWFRVLPLKILSYFVKKSGFFYIHPYDIDEKHPYIGSLWFDFKRHIGLKHARRKLEALLERSFNKPTE